MKPAIHVDKLSKQYRIGPRQRENYRTLREAIVESATAPWRRLRHLVPFFHNGQSEAADSTPARDTIWALKDVSFEVQPGEVIGIIGRNGAGKSTLLKVLSRITEPTAGRVEMRGRVASLLEVGTGFHPELTGRENIFLNGIVLGMKRQEILRKFDDIVNFAEVQDFLDTPVKRYSSGMYVRLAFAVGAYLEPEILVVDEVLAVGDVAFQRKCLGRMQQIGRAGRTVLFVSHNMASIQNLCQRAVLLCQGQVQSVGECTSVINEYLKTNSADQMAGRNLPACRAPGMLDIIKELATLDEEGRKTDCIPCGAPLNVRIRYDSPVPLVNPRFGIIFETLTGERLFFLQNVLQEGWVPQLPQRGVVHCRLPALPLAPGSYALTFGCSTPHKALDLLRQALAITVEAADFYGTGQLPPTVNGKLLVPANWRYEPDAQGDPDIAEAVHPKRD